MRLLIAASILTLALAGCTAPAEEPDVLFGVCPQWLDGDVQELDLEAPGGANLTAAHAMAHLDGNLSLDRYHVALTDIEAAGVLELRAYADDGRALRFTDDRSPHGPRTPTFLALDTDTEDFEVDIYLTAVTHGTEAAPTDIRFEVTGVDGATGSMHLTVTPGYRVCGAVV